MGNAHEYTTTGGGRVSKPFDSGTASGISTWHTGTAHVQHEIPFEEVEPIKLGRKATIDDLLDAIK